MEDDDNVVFGAFGDPDATIQGITTIGELLIQPHAWLSFGSGISVDIQTGEVCIPDGLTLTQAAQEFWNAVAQIRGAALPFPIIKE